MCASHRLLHIAILFCIALAPVSTLYTAEQPHTHATDTMYTVAHTMGIMLITPLSLILLRACYKKIKEIIAPRLVQKIGVLAISGTIEESATLVRQATQFFQNPAIEALLLKIDSPGGSAGASQAIYYALTDLKAIYRKPLIVYSENTLASGAYYIACAADIIITLPSTLVGSIGVIMSYMQLQELLKKISVTYEIITAGSYKATGNPFTTPLEQQTAMLQELCNNTHAQFIADVVQARPQLKEHETTLWGDGQIFDGKHARDLGLVDRLGSQFAVMESIVWLTGNDNPIEWVYPEQPSALELLFGGSKKFDLHASLAWLASKLTRNGAELRFQWCVPS